MEIHSFYLADSVISFPNICPLDSDLSSMQVSSPGGIGEEEEKSFHIPWRTWSQAIIYPVDSTIQLLKKQVPDVSYM